MTFVRETIDPKNTLPVVRFDTLSYSFDAIDRDTVQIVHDNETVGNCDIVYENNKNTRVAHFDGITVRNDKRGQGIGLATYAMAIERAHERGYDFETQNWELTTHSKKIWEHLAKIGLAEVIFPFEPSDRRGTGTNDRFIGRYRVSAPQSDVLIG